MKVLWITNIELPLVGEYNHHPVAVYGGWLDYLSRQLIQSESMYFAFPGKCTVSGNTGTFAFASFQTKNAETFFNKLFEENDFDVVHLFGTEMPHVKGLIVAIKHHHQEKRLLVSIQGSVWAYSYHYLPMLPCSVMHHWGLVELYKKRNLVGDKKEFQKRGKTEKEAIRTATYCEGRTFWDHAIAILINPKAQYVICNEPLRDVFYQQPVWDIETIERHRIFVSQCSYPLKGFHFLLEALVMVKERFPDVVVYTTGPNLLSRNPKVMIRFSRYRWYLRHLFVKYHLQTNVRFLGQLDASAMKQQYLKANVFVSPSSIENSPNSVGEAMILGCPVIASDVGGVSTMMRREEDGFLYQYDAPYLLAYYIMQVFSDDALALRFSKNAQQHARITHNREQILSTQKEIYHKIVASIQEE